MNGYLKVMGLPSYPYSTPRLNFIGAAPGFYGYAPWSSCGPSPTHAGISLMRFMLRDMMMR